MNDNNYYKPDEHSGVCVVKRKGESQEDLLKRFRKKYAKSGLAKEYREKMYYEKPSERKKRKKEQSIRLLKKEEEKLEKMKERSRKFKQKQKRKQAKAKRKGEKHDSSSRRQNYRRRIEENED